MNGGAISSMTQTASQGMFVEIDGTCAFTASGTLNVEGAPSVAADTFNMFAGSFFEIMPVI